MIYRVDRERMQLRVETDELGGELEQLTKAKVSEWIFILSSHLQYNKKQYCNAHNVLLGGIGSTGSDWWYMTGLKSSSKIMVLIFQITFKRTDWW